MSETRRYNFSKKVKKEALARSGGRCEADHPIYGLMAGVRCMVSLAKGVEFDHWPLPATDEGSDVLNNCVAVCPGCHLTKTRFYDIPMQAKGRRIRRAQGPVELRRKTKPIPKPANPRWPKRSFQRRVKA